MSILENLICVLWVVSLVLEKIFCKFFLTRLKRLHAATWKQLGEPVIMMPTLRFLKFLWRRDFNLLPDDKILPVGEIVRRLYICQTILWLLMIVVVLCYEHNHMQLTHEERLANQHWLSLHH